ncbi:DUF134 domain-containing protein [Candidatus Hodarchaeum mangrovi]
MFRITDPNSGRGRGGGRGRRFRGGRPRIEPYVGRNWESSEGKVDLVLTKVELEALLLVDRENFTQEQAAEKMHISRGTFWRILQEARRKVIFALTSGKTLIHLSISNLEAS